jgi:hypothetical protein
MLAVGSKGFGNSLKFADRKAQAHDAHAQDTCYKKNDHARKKLIMKKTKPAAAAAVEAMNDLNLEWVPDVFLGPLAHETGPTDPLWGYNLYYRKNQTFNCRHTKHSHAPSTLWTADWIPNATSGFLVSKLYRTLERREKQFLSQKNLLQQCEIEPQKFC